MINFKQVTKVYPDGTEALHDFSLEIKKGELVTLIGPSGCGKTTTMKMINRLIEPTSGSIQIQNRPIVDYKIHELRWNIGYVLQEIALFPHLTIEDNIAVVPEMKKWKRKHIRQRTAELLEMVGLDPDTYRNKMPDELSGGQQQRIGVVRALAADPDIILMDEPFSALDPISRDQLQQDIRRLQTEIKKTIVFVTHDIDEALTLGDRVCLMQNGEIVQLDTPQQLILHPRNTFVKEFIGDRTSPWQTAVDTIAEPVHPQIMTEQTFTGLSDQTGSFMIKDKANQYMGFMQDGKWLETIQPLDNDLPLHQAVERLQTVNVTVLPVVKGESLIGALTYQTVVQFLKEKAKRTNGMIQQ